MKKYILLAIVGLLLMSCFEDKGNYSYSRRTDYGFRSRKGVVALFYERSAGCSP